MCLFSSKFQIMDGTFIMFVWYPRYTSQVCSKIKLTGNSNSILTALLLNCASSKLCSLCCIFNLLSLFASGDQIKQSSLIHSSPELLLTEKKCSKPKGLNCTFLYKCILDTFFRQIKSFRRFRLAFGFGLQTFYLINFS